VGRGGACLALSLALLGAGASAASAASEGSTDELRLTTTKRGASTGVVASEIFNARYPNGQLKPLRHSLIGFPKGTTFDAAATDTCAAGPDDFKSQGMSACPESTRIGTGHATVTTTGTATETRPVPLDATMFARTDGSIIVFSSDGAYLSSQLVHAKGRFQRTSPPPSCVVVTEQPPCEHGEIVARSLDIKIPPRSRVVDGRRHNLITTPRRCPKSRHWNFFDKHTFADKSFDLFVNHPRCRRR
jgi:hypothetical protein